MIKIDYRNPKPVYEQLIDGLKNLILCGALVPDEQLPSVRQLAKELTINPNTVQKAYIELERSGLTYTAPGRGSFVSPDLSQIRAIQRTDFKERIGKLLAEAHSAGITRDEIINITDEIFKQL